MRTSRQPTLSLMLLLDLTLIGLMVFLPAANYLFRNVKFVSSLDEVVLIFMFFVVFLRFRVASNLRLNMVVAMFITYALFLLIVRDLPASHVIQIAISLKFVVYYFYYNYLPEWYKPILFKKVVKLLLATLWLTLVLGVLEFFVMPNLYTQLFDIQRDGRGLNGIFLTSFFHSRAMFAEYILVTMIVVLAFKERAPIRSFLLSNRALLVTGLLAMLYLSFSRKELACGIIFLCATLYLKYPTSSVVIRLGVSLVALLFLGLVFQSVFEEINNLTLGNEDYIRFNIWRYGMEIFQHYFPMGSGPGTYGTVMSKDYLNVYLQFDVSPDLLGYESRSAAIYDVSLASIAAEYGFFGLVFYFVFLASIYKWGKQNAINEFVFVDRATAMLLIMLVILVFFAPVFTSLVGFMVFLFLGLSHVNRASALGKHVVVCHTG